MVYVTFYRHICQATKSGGLPSQCLIVIRCQMAIQTRMLTTAVKQQTLNGMRARFSRPARHWAPIPLMANNALPVTVRQALPAGLLIHIPYVPVSVSVQPCSRSGYLGVCSRPARFSAFCAVSHEPVCGLHFSWACPVPRRWRLELA